MEDWIIAFFTILGIMASVSGVIIYVFNGTRRTIREIRVAIDRIEQTLSKVKQTLSGIEQKPAGVEQTTNKVVLHLIRLNKCWV